MYLSDYNTYELENVISVKEAVLFREKKIYYNHPKFIFNPKKTLKFKWPKICEFSLYNKPRP